jgi:hypothetical protein
MIRCATHADDQQSLYEDRYAESVHGEAGSVDLDAENVNDALSLFRIWSEQGFYGVGGDV